MAASVRIEDEAFSDRRYDRLAKSAGLADADHARGKMAVLWRQCTIEQTHILPVEDVVDVLGDNAVDALETARLGERVDGGVRIRGTQGRIEWLGKLRKNGKKGGRPRKNQKVSKRETKSEPSGSAELNPPAPAPAPAPALDANAKLSPPKRRRDGPPPGYRETVACFDAAYREHHGGPKPTWGAKQGSQLKRLLSAHGADEVQRRIGVLFRAPPPWIGSRDLGTLVTHFDKLAAEHEPQRRTNEPVRKIGLMQ